jgi:hypothetical protein
LLHYLICVSQNKKRRFGAVFFANLFGQLLLQSGQNGIVISQKAVGLGCLEQLLFHAQQSK